MPSDPAVPNGVRFNTCFDDGVVSMTQGPKRNDNGSSDFMFAYAIAVHEAGHALGLSKFDYSNFVALLGDQSHNVAHPTIPETVMNYDREMPDWVPDQYRPAEPDCSPHPFDVMAIYALYQNVPLVSVP